MIKIKYKIKNNNLTYVKKSKSQLIRILTLLIYIG